MSSVGYVRLYRSLLGHPAFRNDGEAMAFAWMVVRAQWQHTRVRYKERAIELRRGQLAISTRDMAMAMDRDKAWIERLWKRLKSETMIETACETGVTVVTILNYDVFQGDQDTGETAGKAPKKTPARQAQDTEQGREKGKKKSLSPSRATPLPEDFTPDLTEPARKTVDGWPPGMFDKEVARFKDKAKAEGKTFVDWQAAFRTWIGNAETWRHQRGSGTGQSGYRNKPRISAWAPRPGWDGAEPASLDD